MHTLRDRLVEGGFEYKDKNGLSINDKKTNGFKYLKLIGHEQEDFILDD